MTLKHGYWIGQSSKNWSRDLACVQNLSFFASEVEMLWYNRCVSTEITWCLILYNVALDLGIWGLWPWLRFLWLTWWFVGGTELLSIQIWWWNSVDHFVENVFRRHSDVSQPVSSRIFEDEQNLVQVLFIVKNPWGLMIPVTMRPASICIFFQFPPSHSRSNNCPKSCPRTLKY